MKKKHKCLNLDDYIFPGCREITGDELYRINGGGRIEPEQDENPPEEGSSSNADSYTVQGGDTLSQIVYDYNQANGTNLTVDEVAQMSGIENPDLIYPGQSIVFGNSEQGDDSGQSVDPTAQGEQIPQTGETSSTIQETTAPDIKNPVGSDNLDNAQNPINTSYSGWGHVQVPEDSVIDKEVILNSLSKKTTERKIKTEKKSNSTLTVQYSKSNELASDYDRVIEDENEKLIIIGKLGADKKTFSRIPGLAETYFTEVKKWDFRGDKAEYGDDRYSADTPEKMVKDFFDKSNLRCTITEKTFSYYDSKPTWNYEQTSRGYEYSFSNGVQTVNYYDINKDGWIDFIGREK